MSRIFHFPRKIPYLPYVRDTERKRGGERERERERERSNKDGNRIYLNIYTN